METFEDRRDVDFKGRVTVRSERVGVIRSDKWFDDQDRRAAKERKERAGRIFLNNYANGVGASMPTSEESNYPPPSASSEPGAEKYEPPVERNLWEDIKALGLSLVMMSFMGLVLINDGENSYHKGSFFGLAAISIALVVSILTTWYYGDAVYRNVRRRIRSFRRGKR
ncbi:MAG: hypothetical protein QMC36_03115 [Patescibacteria group bacterium]